MNIKYWLVVYSLALVAIGFVSGVYIERDYANNTPAFNTSELNSRANVLLNDMCGSYKSKSTLHKGVIDTTKNDYNGIVVKQRIRCDKLEFTISSFINTSFVPEQELVWSIESSPIRTTVMNSDIPMHFKEDFDKVTNVVIDHLIFGVLSFKHSNIPTEYRSQIDNSLAVYDF